MSASVYAGAAAPEGVSMQVSNAALDGDPLDFTTVTDAEIRVTRPDGIAVVWPLDLTAILVDSMTGEYEFDAGGADVSIPGTYRLIVVLTTSGGTRRAGPTVLQVF